MAAELGNKSSICLLGVHIQFLHLFGIHIPIPKDDTTTDKNPKKRSLIKSEPIFFDDNHHDHDESMLKKAKTHHHENLGVINAQPVGWLNPLASSPVYHFVPANPAHLLWNFITAGFGGKKIELIIQKSLEKTDLDGHQARLSMPKSHILGEFLTKEEEDLLEAKEKLNIMVIDPCLRAFELRLGKWKYHKKMNKDANVECSDDQSRTSWSYVLITGWNKLREANNSSLTVSAMIQVWSFRVQDKLGLAIVKI